MTVAAGDGHEFPIYAGRFRITFPLLDADGDLVTGASTPDSEVSIDGGTFADCTNEMTELATNSGIYRLDLTAAEMTGKTIAIIAKSATSGMKTTPIILNPKRMPILRSGTAQAGAGSTITLDSGASAKDGAYVGMWVQCSNNSPSNVQGQTRKIISYVGSTKVATVEAAWGTNPSSATTFDILLPETVNINAWMGKETIDWNTAGYPVVDTQKVSGTTQTARDIGASVLLSSGTGTGQLDFTSGVVKANVTQNGGSNITSSGGRQEVNVSHFGGSAGTFASGRPEVNTSHIAGSSVSTSAAQIGVNVVQISGDVTSADNLESYTDGTTPMPVNVTHNAGSAITSASGIQEVKVASLANNAITAASINADAITAAKVASDVTTELQSGLATASALSTVAGYLDTEIADIKTKTDQLVFTVSNQLDVNVKSNDGTAITAASGIQEVKVASIAANAITATSIASDAITDAKVASDVTIASVTGAVGSVTGNVGGNVTGSVGSLASQAKSDVNAEVLDVLTVDTFAQPGQESPAATTTLGKMLAYLYKAWRNKHTQTASEYALYADDGTTKDQEAAVSDDSTTFERGEVQTGA